MNCCRCSNLGGVVACYHTGPCSFCPTHAGGYVGDPIPYMPDPLSPPYLPLKTPIVPMSPEAFTNTLLTQLIEEVKKLREELVSIKMRM